MIPRELWVFCLLLGLGMGCGSVRRAAVGESGPVFLASMRAYESETDLAIARAAAPAILKMVEGLLETAPGNRELLEVLARGWAEYAFGFLEDDLESLPDDGKHADERQRLVLRASALYDRAFTAAVERLELDLPDIRQVLAGDAAGLERRLASAPKDSVPGLMFAGLALSSAANLNRGDPSRAVDMPKAIALLERSRALDAAYYHGGAPMILGIIFCASPKAAGGDPERGRRYFAEAMAQSQAVYLLAPVMAARTCDLRLGEKTRFEKTLREALAAPPAPDRRAWLANEVAKRRAARYLADAEATGGSVRK